MKKVGKFFGCLGPVAAFLGVQVVVSFVGSIIMMIGIGVTQGSDAVMKTMTEISKTGTAPYIVWLTLAATACTTLMGALWYGLVYLKKHDYSIKEVAEVKDFLYIALLALAAVFFTDIIMWLVELIFPNSMDSYEKLINNAITSNSFVMVVSAIILAPFGEEFIFRGIVMRKAERFMPFIVANIFQAFLFGLVHGNIVQSSYAFLLGLMLGYIRHKYESVWMSIFGHFSYNLLGVLIPSTCAGLPKMVQSSLSIAAIPVIALMIFLISKKHVQPKYQGEPVVEQPYIENGTYTNWN